MSDDIHRRPRGFSRCPSTVWHREYQNERTGKKFEALAKGISGSIHRCTSYLRFFSNRVPRGRFTGRSVKFHTDNSLSSPPPPRQSSIAMEFLSPRIRSIDQLAEAVLSRKLARKFFPIQRHREETICGDRCHLFIQPEFIVSQWAAGRTERRYKKQLPQLRLVKRRNCCESPARSVGELVGLRIVNKRRTAKLFNFDELMKGY